WAVSSTASLVVLVGLMLLNRPEFDQGAVSALTDDAAAFSAAPPSMKPQRVESLPLAASSAPSNENAPMAEPVPVDAPQLTQAQLLTQDEQLTPAQPLTKASLLTDASEGGQTPAFAPEQGHSPVSAISADKLTTPLADALKKLQQLIDNKEFSEALALEQQLLAAYPELHTLSQAPADKLEIGPGVSAKLWREFKALQQQLHQGIK
ncbi:MAG: hypothetical protein ACRDBI_11270, partial [Shewanella sp.]